jgi:hypothetical protein
MSRWAVHANIFITAAAYGMLQPPDVHLELHLSLAPSLPCLAFFTPPFLSGPYARHPEDVWSIVSKDDILFAKSGRVTATKEWLGNGVFSQLDLDKHTAARATLNPAFRRDYLARLDSFMKGSAQQLADILTAAAAAAAAGSECSAGVSSTASGAGVGPEGGGSTAALDMQRMFRLTTLDTLGLTGLNRSFKALSLWQQQQQVSTQDVGMSGSSSSDGQLELEQLLWDLESAFLWQALRLPVPSEPDMPQCLTLSHNCTATAGAGACYSGAAVQCAR